MFGWEFPPHIAGGLGTACYGMTRGLARNDVDVTFVMPRASGDEDERFIKVVNASDIETVFGNVSADCSDIIEKMSFIHVDSNLVPYLSPEDYESYHDEFVKTGEKRWETSDVWSQRYTFSGKYGANIMEEVARYAVVAAEVAPANADYQTVRWTSGDPRVATVDSSGKILALSPGTTVITAASAEPGSTVCDTITVVVTESAVMKTIPVADAEAALYPARMWERPAVPITAEPSMTAHSLIHPMTEESRWSSYAVPA